MKSYQKVAASFLSLLLTAAAPLPTLAVTAQPGRATEQVDEPSSSETLTSFMDGFLPMSIRSELKTISGEPNWSVCAIRIRVWKTKRWKSTAIELELFSSILKPENTACSLPAGTKAKATTAGTGGACAGPGAGAGRIR